MKAMPLKEGYIDKGGRNDTFQITERPPARAPMRNHRATDPASLVVVQFLRIKELEHEVEMLRRDLAMERAKGE
jgi:hypothetical protein